MTNMIASSIDRIDYEESGTGPTVIFVPGSCSTGAAWRPVIAALGGQFRCITTSLPGYGGTAERRSPIDPPVLREVEVVEHVVRRAVDSRDVPVHLVGHSFGGLVGLAMALGGTVRLASLTILEAPLPGVLQACDEAEAYRAFRDMTDRYFAAYRAGQPEAIAVMIDFYGGAGTFASWPRRLQDHVVTTTPVNMLDWNSAYGFQPAPTVLQKILVPTQVVCGGLSHPAVRRGNELVSIHLPNASYSAIRDARHFMLGSHPDEVAYFVARHVNEHTTHRSP